MKPKAIIAAEEKLRSAHESYFAVKNAKTMHEIRKTWHEFLIHSNQVFSKLEQGAKEGSSKGWYDKIRNLRKKEPLLRYLQHSRNAAEHGDTILENDDVFTGNPAHGTLIFDKSNFNLDTGKPTGPPRGMASWPAQLILKTVMDSGISYSPPPSYPTDAQFAPAVLDHLAELIKEAKARIEKAVV